MNLYYLLVPHPKNNHRSKILHHASLFFIIIVFTFINFLGIVVNNSHPEVLGISYSISEKELLDLVNFEREQNGLSKLTINDQLSEAAREKASHMFANNYWAHFAPDGTTPWSFIKSNQYDYLYAGENLAKGYTKSVDVVNAWMNSPTHKANILSPKFNDIGFAISDGRLQDEDTVLIVQMFGATQDVVTDNTVPPVPTAQAVAQNNTPITSEALGSKQTTTQVVENTPIIDTTYTTRVVVFFVLSLLIMALLIDLIVVERNKIPRIVGNNLDHIILIIIFLSFIFTNNIGSIL